MYFGNASNRTFNRVMKNKQSAASFFYTHLAKHQPLMQRYFTKAVILDGNLVDRAKAKHVTTNKPQVITPAGGSFRKTKAFSS